MAGETNNLDLSQMSPTQNQKSQTNNDGNAQIDAAITGVFQVTVTNTNAATVAELDVQRNVAFVLTPGSPIPSAPITITVADVVRGFTFWRNTTAQDAEVEISGQSEPAVAIAAGSYATIYSDGDNLYASSFDPGALGTMAFQDANAVAITGGTVTGLPSPVGSSDATNKSYVDTAVANGGLNGLVACQLATTAVLPDTPTYNNGTAGVGATLTAGANGALSVDGVPVVVGNRVLVKDQSAAEENGIYSVTDEGDASNPYILTRSTDFDTSAEMVKNSFAFIQTGSTLTGSSWLLNDSVPTVGVDPVDFVQFAGSSGGANYVVTQITSGGATNVSFPSIPQSYRNATLRVWGQAANGGTGTQEVWVRINGLSGASGNFVATKNANGTITGSGNGGQTQQWIGNLPQSGNPYYGQIICDILNYTNSTAGQLLNSRGNYIDAAFSTSLNIGGLWNVAAPITQLDVLLNSGAFVDGTVVELTLEP